MATELKDVLRIHLTNESDAAFVLRERQWALALDTNRIVAKLVGGSLVYFSPSTSLLGTAGTIPKFGSIGLSDSIISENGGTVSVAGSLSRDGDDIFTATTHSIRANTSDGSDNKRLVLGGGGAPGSVSRGAFLALYGNEFAQGGGSVILAGGEAGNISLATGPGQTDRLTINSSGGASFTGTLSVNGLVDLSNSLRVTGGNGIQSNISGINRWLIDRNGTTLEVGDGGGWTNARYRTGSGTHEFEVGGVGYLSVGQSSTSITSTATSVAGTLQVNGITTLATTNLVGGSLNLDNGQSVNGKNAGGTIRQMLVLQSNNSMDIGGTIDGSIRFFTGLGNVRGVITSGGRWLINSTSDHGETFQVDGNAWISGAVTLTSSLNISGATAFAGDVYTTGSGKSLASGPLGIIAAYGVGRLNEANMERLSLTHTGNYASIYSEANGSGTVRPIRMGFNASNYLLELTTGGNVGIGGMPAADINYDLTVAKSKAGSTVGLKVMNLSTASDSPAMIRIESEGSGSGDVYQIWDQNGIRTLYGFDVTDGYFKVQTGMDSLSTGNYVYRFNPYSPVFELGTSAKCNSPIQALAGVHFLSGGSRLNHYEEGSFTINTGLYTSVTYSTQVQTTCTYVRIGKMVQLHFEQFTGMPSSSTFRINGIPSRLRPASPTEGIGISFNIGTDFYMGQASALTSGEIYIYRYSTSNMNISWVAGDMITIGSFGVTLITD